MSDSGSFISFGAIVLLVVGFGLLLLHVIIKRLRMLLAEDKHPGHPRLVEMSTVAVNANREETSRTRILSQEELQVVTNDPELAFPAPIYSFRPKPGEVPPTYSQLSVSVSTSSTVPPPPPPPPPPNPFTLAPNSTSSTLHPAPQ